MTKLLFDGFEILALNGYVQNIAKIRETCKEASQLPMLEERFESEWWEYYYNNNAFLIQEWWRYMRLTWFYTCGDCSINITRTKYEQDAYCESCKDEINSEIMEEQRYFSRRFRE
jgi:hypothetical protein